MSDLVSNHAIRISVTSDELTVILACLSLGNLPIDDVDYDDSVIDFVFGLRLEHGMTIRRLFDELFSISLASGSIAAGSFEGSQPSSDATHGGR